MTQDYDESVDPPDETGAEVAAGRAVDARIEQGIAAWRERLTEVTAPLADSDRARAGILGMPQTRYRELVKGKTPPKLADLLRLHVHGGFRVVDQLQMLLDLDDDDLDVRRPLWQPRLTSDHLVDSLRELLTRSRASIPTVVDIGERVIDSCRATGDAGRWRVRYFDVKGGWHFPHVAFEAVEFMRWYGPDNGVDEDPWATRAASYLGVDDVSVAPDRWIRHLTPAPLRRNEPPATFEPEVDTPRRAAGTGTSSASNEPS